MTPAPSRVVVRAPGKINLSLGVGAVDAHGYHALATVFQAVDLYETVTASRADTLSLEMTSSVPGELPLDGSNLALRAAELMREEFSLTEGAALHIDKQVPIAGGMGGGSADAAAALVALDRLWGLGLGGEGLRRLGARLGADVPFAMLGHTALGRGNGGDLTTVLTHGEWTWLLAIPGGHLSTPQVFRTFDEIVRTTGRRPAEQPEVDERQLQALSGGNIELLAETLENDLQVAAFALHPGLEPVVETAERLGAPAALVSGSGPTVAVLVEDEAQARSIAAGLMRDSLVDSCLVVRGSAPGASVLVEE
ncbi:4-(cytidine 5'-diphospho)-2-C-methyl-D-erythritol kinase [Brachybacterium sp. AOP43-C2-M15]|uniref:4-(cytidine 5'-diphospho)-2-C-methyl-D-erythritol kinase n=1 Tax=Brachybacterium sp. AOP43-C2-M15 TaxID=3457661 RepID=UPI004033D2F0